MTTAYDFCEANGLLVPGYCHDEALDFLSSFGAGGIGGGGVMLRMGSTIPAIRDGYYAELEKAQAAAKLMETKLAPDAFNRWKIEERIRIAKLLRQRQGVIASVTLDLRDRIKYGPGGRTVDDLIARKVGAAARHGETINESEALARLGRSWAAPNAEVTAAARGARYLKYGGRVFFVAGIGAAAYSVVTAPEQERLHVAAREGAGIAGGAAVSSLAVGLAIGFGIVTGGWGLVAIGLIGGIGGSMAAEAGVNRLFFSHDSRGAEQRLNEGGLIHHSALTPNLPH